MTEFRIWVAGLSLLGSVTWAAGCQAAPATPGSPSFSPQPPAVPGPAAASAFNPPADGRISETQIDLYLAVEARATEIRQAVATAPEADADAAFQRSTLAERAAATELGVDIAELEWVRDRVLEARLAERSLALAREAEAGRQEFLASLQGERRKELDPVRIAALDRHIRDLRVATAESQTAATAAIRANIATLFSRQEELERQAAANNRIPADAALAPAAGARDEVALVRTPR